MAPQLPTYNPATTQSQFLGQNFSGEQAASNAVTKNTSAANLTADTTGLNSIDAGALPGINAEENLGNSLLSGSLSGLPDWAKTSINNAQMQGAESAVGRGVGAFSGNGISGINEYMGNNALNLINTGAQLSSNASQQAQGIVGSTLYKNDPWNSMMSTSQIQQGDELNTQIGGQQATDNAAVTNWNNNNSPLGSAIRTGMQTLTYLAGSFLGGSGGKAIMAGA